MYLLCSSMGSGLLIAPVWYMSQEYSWFSGCNLYGLQSWPDHLVHEADCTKGVNMGITHQCYSEQVSLKCIGAKLTVEVCRGLCISCRSPAFLQLMVVSHLPQIYILDLWEVLRLNCIKCWLMLHNYVLREGEEYYMGDLALRQASLTSCGFLPEVIPYAVHVCGTGGRIQSSQSVQKGLLKGIET